MRLTAEDLAGERGGEEIFSGVSFSLDAGQCLIVTGENGAGKSTLLRIVAGLLPPAAGRILFDAGAGSSPVATGEGDHAKHGGGGADHLDFATLTDAAHYLGEKNAMKAAMTVAENLAFRQKFLGHPFHTVEEALDAIDLPTVASLPFGYLSTGQRRRVAIAGLLISYRPVWLLDEPTAGLDLGSERRFADLMRGHLEDGGIIIAATHAPLGIEGAKELEMGEALG